MTGEEQEEEEEERKKRRRKPEKSPARSGEISFGSEAAGCQLLTVNVCLVLRGERWGGMSGVGEGLVERKSAVLSL